MTDHFVENLIAIRILTQRRVSGRRRGSPLLCCDNKKGSTTNNYKTEESGTTVTVRVMRHRAHPVRHGPGKDMTSGSAVIGPRNRSILGGGARMSKDLGDGRKESGTNGRVEHGPTLTRPGPMMTVARGRHIDQVAAAARELHPGGNFD